MAGDPFSFRPLVKEDLETVHRWVNAEHARKGYGGGASREELLEEYVPMIERRIPIEGYIVAHEGQEIGLMEWERLGDFPELQRAYGVTDPDTANCDVIIGEPAAAHRGLGPALIQAFLTRIVFADPRITSIVIDPMTDNFIAIRAYEKAGFRFVRAVADDLEGGSVYLMELRREELGVPREQGPYLRPARPEELGEAIAIDDDAVRAYADVGLAFQLENDAPFVAAEVARWRRAVEEGLLYFACAPGGERIGFASLGMADGRPYLQQISVRRAWMRRGIGRLLLERAQRWSVRAGELWLTTYDVSVPWNEPWYARAGFTRVSDEACGAELRATLLAERRALPAPERRTAMVYRHPR